MDLATCYGTTLVVLASHDCEIEEAAALMAQTPRRGRAVFVTVPVEQDHDLLRLATSDDRFRALSGAALGVNTSSDRCLEVFRDVYNEDWFALAGEAESSGVANVGDVRQLPYNPFENPQRAAHEEFGDLVAEGLYALSNDGLSVSLATEAYSAGFIGGRRRLVADIAREIAQNETNELVQASTSLQSAQYQLDIVTPATARTSLRPGSTTGTASTPMRDGWPAATTTPTRSPAGAERLPRDTIRHSQEPAVALIGWLGHRH